MQLTSKGGSSNPAIQARFGHFHRQTGKLHGLLWVAMITSAGNRVWPGDVPVANLPLAGLPFASGMRPAKIATIGASDASKIGSLGPARLKQVKRWISMDPGVRLGS
jgi:hypothetical protein